MQPFGGFSVILNFMTLNEHELLFHVKILLPCLCEIIPRVAYLTELVRIEA